jgi:hypothetical protein
MAHIGTFLNVFLSLIIIIYASYRSRDPDEDTYFGTIFGNLRKSLFGVFFALLIVSIEKQLH